MSNPPPPVVPGPGEPPEPYYQPPVYYPPQPPQQPQPVPVYQVGASRSDIVGKSMIGTVVVVATLFLLICVLPMALCVGCGALGNITSGT